MLAARRRAGSSSPGTTTGSHRTSRRGSTYYEHLPTLATELPGICHDGDLLRRRAAPLANELHRTDEQQLHPPRLLREVRRIQPRHRLIPGPRVLDARRQPRRTRHRAGACRHVPRAQPFDQRGAPKRSADTYSSTGSRAARAVNLARAPEYARFARRAAESTRRSMRRPGATRGIETTLARRRMRSASVTTLRSSGGRLLRGIRSSSTWCETRTLSARYGRAPSRPESTSVNHRHWVSTISVTRGQPRCERILPVSTRCNLGQPDDESISPMEQARGSANEPFPIA